MEIDIFCVPPACRLPVFVNFDLTCCPSLPAVFIDMPADMIRGHIPHILYWFIQRSICNDITSIIHIESYQFNDFVNDLFDRASLRIQSLQFSFLIGIIEFLAVAVF